MPEEPAVDALSGALSGAYAGWRESTLGRITDALEQRLVLELLGPAQGRHILDVGCGDGVLAVELARQGAEVTGIDQSASMIAAARARAERQAVPAKFAVADVSRLPFPEMFDAVVAITLLCFVRDAPAAIGEMARSLRPGGQLILGELNRRSLWAAGRRIRGWLGSEVWGPASFRSPRELTELADAAGLEVQQLRGAVYYPPCGLAARMLNRWDPKLGDLSTAGAAFLAMSAIRETSAPGG